VIDESYNELIIKITNSPCQRVYVAHHSVESALPPILDIFDRIEITSISVNVCLSGKG
jgi:hypothetical protein